ncbi:hypothetical protein [Psychromonas sp. CNPT3]|uniref:hypothetical protein n=1 Tax=Psychromonas sp. CNPT3 TaxID=314282 RepID=UPI00006E78C7|nr:hypothetical protein [Psychromonas sp. CNPT3]
MLETIKKIFNRIPSRAMTEYYQSRLQLSSNITEIEAILAMNTLLSLNEQERPSEAFK